MDIMCGSDGTVGVLPHPMYSDPLYTHAAHIESTEGSLMTEREAYPEQDHMALGEYYLRHIDRMTAEGLHRKSDIAAQLAWRDREIDRLRASTSIPAGEPVAWTLTETLTKRETTTRGHLWFTDPVNSLWTPLYATPPSPPAPKVVPLSEEQIYQAWLSYPSDALRTNTMRSDVLYAVARAIEAAHGIGPKDDVHQT
jgi:hypothetical protein